MLRGCTFRRKRYPSKSAFTLIELLVVIAIIAILAAILFPVFSRVRDKARQAVCTSNMKNIGMAFQMYAQDYDGKFPTPGGQRMYGDPGAPTAVSYTHLTLPTNREV